VELLFLVYCENWLAVIPELVKATQPISAVVLVVFKLAAVGVNGLPTFRILVVLKVGKSIAVGATRI
jgi:hypothetical protein